MFDDELSADAKAHQQQFDIVGARMLNGFPQLCATMGTRPEDLFDAARISLEGSSRLPERITYREFLTLLTSAAKMLRCTDFGMRLAIFQSGTGLYGPLGSSMLTSRTLGEALDYVTGHAHVHSPAARIARHSIPGRDGVLFSHEILVGAYGQQAQAMEHILLAGHLGAAALTGGRSRARRVLLRHRPVSPMPVYRRNFGCEVLFDQPVDGIIFSKQDLANSIVGQDRDLHLKIIESIAARFPAQAPPVEAATRAAILRLMQIGPAANSQVAAHLGMNTRALHRRLREAGTTFQKIKDEVRCELVRYYVAHTELSFLWITGKLNFAEQAVFTRFCRRHLGGTPTELREQAARIQVSD
jgi:AraC-like DNA-binding protein